MCLLYFSKTEAKNKYFGKERNLSYICNILSIISKDMEKEKNSKITREEALRRLETARKLKREYVAKLEKEMKEEFKKRTGQEASYFEVW